MIQLTSVPKSIASHAVVLIGVFADAAKAKAKPPTGVEAPLWQWATTHPTFKGAVGEVLCAPILLEKSTRHVVFVGLGNAKQHVHWRRASAAASRLVCQHQWAKALWLLPQTDVDFQAIAEGWLLGPYQFTLRKSGEAAKPKSPAVLLLAPETALTGKAKAEAAQQLSTGSVMAEATNLARTWVFDGPNHVTPSFLAKQATALAASHKGQLTCKILDAKAMAKLGMGALLFVTKGSQEPPALIHLILKTGVKTGKTLALIGKGITFDSGGLSLKPSGSMELMKMDMAGAAAVLATMHGVCALLKQGANTGYKTIHVVIPTCENMPSGHASRPGDIITAMNGKTIEVNNTDAEGRLILADAMTYIQREVPALDEMIDLATLTGACIMALGTTVAGMMGNEVTGDDISLQERLKRSAEAAGEMLWPLPLLDAFDYCLKSPVADLINSGSGGEAGSSAGGMFLKSFLEPTFKGQWAHLDIAGPAYSKRDVPEVPKGATGFGVRTLLRYILG